MFRQLSAQSEMHVRPPPSSVAIVVSVAQRNERKRVRRQDEGSPSHSTVGAGSSNDFQYFKSQKETGWSPAGELRRQTKCLLGPGIIPINENL